MVVRVAEIIAPFLIGVFTGVFYMAMAAAASDCDTCTHSWWYEDCEECPHEDTDECERGKNDR